MMTPGDIPDSVVDHAADEIRANLGHGITATPHEAAAAILNAAIEAGIVVPASEATVLRRALALLRTIRREGYTPGGDGSIAIEQRIKELENLER